MTDVLDRPSVAIGPNGFPLKGQNGRGDISQDALILDLDRISQEIIAADGNIALVAEKILGSAAKTDQILAAITADPAALDAFSIKVKAYCLIKAMGVFSQLSTVVMGTLGDIPPREAIKAFTDLGRMMGEIADKKPSVNITNSNSIEVLLATLPESMRAAVGVALEADKGSVGEGSGMGEQTRPLTLVDGEWSELTDS